MSISAQEAAEHLLRLQDAEDSYLGFIRLLYPKFKLPQFQIDLINALDALERGTLQHPDGRPARKVLITMPPRHAKSTFGTVNFPVYYMAKNPERYVLSCSYNAQLAADFGRQARDIATSVEVQQAFPNLRISSDSRAADVWRTEQGGAYFGVGIGGTTTGRPANLLLIDDPIKSREEAESASQRNKVWDFYTASLSTRPQPDTSGNEPIEILILTRWHPDDLAGRVQQLQDWKEGMWLHLDFPAMTTKVSKVPVSQLPETDPRHKTIAEMRRLKPEDRSVSLEQKTALWPERFPVEELERRRRLNPRDFESLYQQRPYIEGGNLIKTEWWRYYPDDLNPNTFQQLIISCDTAFKKSETADYSAIVIAGLASDGDIYIVQVMRGKWEYPELRQRLINLNAQWRGRGLRAIYVEDKASGQSIIQDLRRESGLAIVPYKVAKDKVSRVNAVTPILEGGRVYLPERAGWLDTFVSECTAFPSGKNDDQVDAFAMAIDILSRQMVTPESVFNGMAMGSSLNQEAKTIKGSLGSMFGGNIFRGWGE